jgi:hypothetical protein
MTTRRQLGDNLMTPALFGRTIDVMTRVSILLVVVAAATVAAVLAAQRAPERTGVPAAAESFLRSLDADLRARAVLPFDDDYRYVWNYTPVSRRGVAWGQMNSEQQKAAMGLLRAALGDRGLQKAEAIRALEDVLAELERNPTRRDPKLFTFTFFGEPSASAFWGWRYEGHHLSLNFAYEGERLVSSTPQFLGAHPAEVRDGPQKGARALAEEEDRGFALLRSLTEEQRKKAVIGDVAPRDIMTTNTRTAAIEGRQGLAHREMTPDQREALALLVRTYAEVQAPEEAARRLAAIEKEGWGEIVFAWMGSLEPGQGHYYRIQGGTFLIEYDNTQNRANHIHSVWRDFKGDFGRDTLAQHYAKAPHDHGHDPVGR